MATAKKPERPFDLMMALGRVCDEFGIEGEQRDELMCWFAEPRVELVPAITDESIIARNHALREALRNLTREHESVVEHCIDQKQHIFAKQQERLHRAARALNVAKAALVEEEGK